MEGIAEPLYSLLVEVFDLRSVFKWPRKSLIEIIWFFNRGKKDR
jgi:hypothetical protein